MKLELPKIWMPDLWICGLLLACVAAVYLQVRTFEFVRYDDDRFVYENPHIRQGVTLHLVKWAFTAGTSGGDREHADYWRPLSFLSHAVDVEIFGMDSRIHHLVSVIIHAAAVVMLYLALKALTASVWCSAYVSALFAVHPMHVESVAWIAERKDVLTGMFLASTLFAYGRYAKSAGFSGKWYGCVVLSAFCALMSKPSMVTLPAVLLLIDYWPLNRMNHRNLGRLVWEKIPVIAMAAAVVAATLASPSYAKEGMQKLSLGERLGNAAVSYLMYVFDAFWPANLAVFYPHPAHELSWPKVAAAAVGLGVITAGAFCFRRSRPYLLVGWLWFLGVLVPMVGIVASGSQARADRYAYLSLIGLYVAFTWFVSSLWPHNARARSWKAAIGALSIVLLAAVAHTQVRHWKNSETLWRRALAVVGPHFMVLNGYAAALEAAGRIEEATLYYNKALEAEPRWTKLYLNLGNLHAKKGDFETATKWFERLVQVDPGNSAGLTALGMARLKMDDQAGAMAAFNDAVNADPLAWRALLELGRNAGKNGDAEVAREFLIRAEKASPNSIEIKGALGNVEASRGNLPEAISYFSQVKAMNPEWVTNRFNLAVTLSEAGRYTEAAEEFQFVLQRRADWAEAQAGLGDALLKLGMKEKAADHYRKALDLQPERIEWIQKLQATGQRAVEN